MCLCVCVYVCVCESAETALSGIYYSGPCVLVTQFYLTFYHRRHNKSQLIPAMPHIVYVTSLCAGHCRFEEWVSEISLKLGREPVTSSVAGKHVNHSATVNRWHYNISVDTARKLDIAFGDLLPPIHNTSIVCDRSAGSNADSVSVSVLLQAQTYLHNRISSLINIVIKHCTAIPQQRARILYVMINWIKFN